MVRWKEGIVSLGNDTIIFPGYKFEDFVKTSFYNGQDANRMIYLDDRIVIDEHEYMTELFFRKGVLYMLSLICCDKDFSMEHEHERKEIHDKVLEQYQIQQNEKLLWGKVLSEYDARGNISSIDFYYLNN